MNTLLLPCLVLHGLTTVLFFLCVRRSLPVQQAETETLFVLLLPFFGAGWFFQNSDLVLMCMRCKCLQWGTK